MTDTDRMVAWLRQTLNEAQRDAEAATSSPWYVSEHKYDEDFEAQIGGWPEGADIAGHGYEGGGVDTMATARHMVRHQPAAVLRRIAKDRELLDDLLTEPHAVLTPGGSTQIYCDGDSNPDEPCDCGRDARVRHRVRLLAEAWGWPEETT